jgi:hypothetical protein
MKAEIHKFLIYTLGDVAVNFMPPQLWRRLKRGPNFAVEWLTLLLRIQEVPVSNVGLENGYHD